MSKVRRKPPPAFPYSPRYPVPDPLDPFAPLKVLRERASSNNALQFRLDDSSPVQGQFLPSLSSDVLGAGLDISYPPTSSDHHGPLTPPRPWADSTAYLSPPRLFQDPSGGYHSDTITTKPTRPLRPRNRAGRESKAYFSEAELPPVPPPVHRQQEPHQTEPEQSPDQYQYRRRSKSVFIPRPASQAQGQDQNEPPLADVSPTNASTEALTTPHAEPKSDTDTVHDLVRQYMYDDRQSHGYIFDQFASDSDVQDSPTVDAHAPEQSQSQPSATPPMTPDDTLSLSSLSARGRSASLSPRSLVPDLPLITSQPALHPKPMQLDEHAIIVQQEEAPQTAPIQSADFRLLRTPSRPPSPGPSPPALSAESLEKIVETDQEPETSTLRRRTLSASRLLRRSSSTGTGGSRRRSKILSVHDFLVKKPSTGSNASKSSRRVGKAAPAHHVDASVSTDTSRNTVLFVASSAPVPVEQLQLQPQPQLPKPQTNTQSHSHAQEHKPAKPPPTAMATRPRNISSNRDRGADSDPGHGGKGPRFIMHRPKKSLSQVSLALAGLPNVGAGPPLVRSANASIGSAMTSGTGVGSISGLSGDEMSTQTHELSLLQRPPASAPPVPGLGQAPSYSAAVAEVPRRPVEHERRPEVHLPKASDKPPLTERSARRLSGFPILDEGDAIIERKQEPSEVRPRASERRATQIAAGLTGTRPLTIISSRAASPEQDTPDNSMQLLERPSPPRSHSRNAVPPIPARTPTPDRQRPSYRNSPLPPPPTDSPPQFYLSPLPPPTDTDLLQPTPLPRSPPQNSEPPTPLPLPTPRAKSPVPPVPHSHSRPREVHDVVPTVIRNEIAVEHPMPMRSGTPPMDSRQRVGRQEPSREERSGSRQSTYLPGAHMHPQPHQLQPIPRPDVHSESRPKVLERRRVSTAQISGPVQQSTPPSDLSQHNRIPVSPPTPYTTFRPQSPEPETPYQYASYPPPSHDYARTQSPPPVPEFRAQSPSPPQTVSHSRVRSPPMTSRVQTPSSRKASRARSPHSAQDHTTVSRGRSYDQLQGFGQLSRQETVHSNGTQGSPSPSNARHHDTAPATPVPHHMSPSPSPSANSPSEQYMHTEPRRARSYQPLREQPQDRHQQRLIGNLRFDEYAIPTRDQLKHAGSLFVVAQNGLRVQFSDLFKDRRTVVCFIRHFWCPADQDYMYSIVRSVNAEELKRAGIDLVIIGVGSPAMIKSYRQIFRSPFPVYTDPTMRLHAALGMTRRTQDMGLDEERGDYVRHGPLSGLAMVVKNAIRVGMPVWERGGDVAQLGGEFVLGPGSTCIYTHRMRTTRSHAPVLHILSVAGFTPGHPGIPVSSPSNMSQDDDDEAWMEDRRRSYARMQARREKRQEALGGGSGRQQHYRREDSRDTAGGYASDAGSGESAVARVESRGRERGGRRAYPSANDEKRGLAARRGFIVANPDFGPPTPLTDETYGEHGWEGDVSDLPYIDGIGRTRDESYRLTQEMLAYSFGKQ